MLIHFSLEIHVVSAKHSKLNLMKNSICPEERRVQLRLITFIATLPPTSLGCGELLRIEKVNDLYLFLLLIGPIFDKYYGQ